MDLPQVGSVALAGAASAASLRVLLPCVVSIVEELSRHFDLEVCDLRLAGRILALERCVFQDSPGLVVQRAYALLRGFLRQLNFNDEASGSIVRRSDLNVVITIILTCHVIEYAARYDDAPLELPTVLTRKPTMLELCLLILVERHIGEFQEVVELDSSRVGQRTNDARLDFPSVVTFAGIADGSKRRRTALVNKASKTLRRRRDKNCE